MDWFDSPRSDHPPTPTPLPSILDLGQLANAAATNNDPPPSENAADEEARGMLLWDREVALRDLLLTFRAKTLGDAVTQLYVAFIAADDLLGFELPPEDRDRKATAVRRALLSAIPVVAEAAALDLALIGGEYIPEFAAREFPMEVAHG
jgi:hypothetical protein